MRAGRKVFVGDYRQLKHDGRRLTAVGINVPGSTEAPMSWQDLRRKFDDCASAGATPLSGKKLAAIHALVDDLENATDATQMLALCSETSCTSSSVS
jgi:hypothetical protein